MFPVVSLAHSLRDLHHVLAVAGPAQPPAHLVTLRGADEPHPQRHLLQAGDVGALALPEGADELAGTEQREGCVPVSNQAYPRPRLTTAARPIG